MPIDALDEYDIQQSFEAMDDDKINRLTLANFHTLYLGLGFQPQELTVEDLAKKVEDAIEERREEGRRLTVEDVELIDLDYEAQNPPKESFIPLSIVLEILSQHTRDRSSEINRCFELLDQSSKGYATIEDLQSLSQEVGQPITAEQATILMGTEPMSREEFRKVFSPPSP